INVTNTSGATALVVDDSADAGAKSVTIGAASLSGALVNTATVNYSGLGSLQVKGGGGGNTFAVNDTPPATTTLDAGGGADAVNVVDPGGPVTVNGQAGANTVTLGAASNNVSTFGGNVPVTATGGTTTLGISDSADATGRTFTVTGTDTTLASPAL